MLRAALLLTAARVAAADNCATDACAACCSTDPAVGLCLPCKPCINLKVGPCAACWTVNDTVTPPSACLVDDGSHCQACWADGPAPPAPAPPSADTYQCASGSCVVQAGGVDLKTCQQLCHAPAPTPPSPPPPPPSQQYQCIGGQCAKSASGIDLKVCQQVCHAPPAPTPPTPPAPALYQCASGKCTASATGIDLKTCQQLCHAPAPPGANYTCASGVCKPATTGTPGIPLGTCQQMCNPPADLYKCSSNQCVASATGTDLTTCQQLCHAPAPPLPTLPPLPKTCGAGVGCAACVGTFVEAMLTAVESGVGGNWVPMSEAALTAVYDLVELITVSCAATNTTHELSSAFLKLRQLAPTVKDERMRGALHQLLRAVPA